MTSVTDTPKAKMKFKTFTYHTELQWIAPKAGMLKSADKPQFRVASPPEFKGEDGVWTPEDLYVASIESCILMTFAAFAQKKDLPVISYTSNAQGVLEFENGAYRFTRVIVKPHIVVGVNGDLAAVESTLQQAHEKCLISNSIQTEIIIEPHIETKAA